MNPTLWVNEDASETMWTCGVCGIAYRSLVLVDLAHYVHLSWFHVACKAAGAPAPLTGTELAAASADQWRGILLDVECRRAVA